MLDSSTAGEQRATSPGVHRPASRYGTVDKVCASAMILSPPRRAPRPILSTLSCDTPIASVSKPDETIVSISKKDVNMTDSGPSNSINQRTFDTDPFNTLHYNIQYYTPEYY